MNWKRAIRKYGREIGYVILAGPVLAFVIALMGGLIVRAWPVLPSVGGTSAQAAWIGFFGNFSGGIIGGVVALFILQRQKRDQMQQSQRALFTQLGYTYNKLANTRALRRVNVMIYDAEWSKHMAHLEYLTSDEFDAIVEWFYVMKRIEANPSGYSHTEAALSVPGISNTVRPNFDEIKRMLEKYGYDKWV